MTKSTIASAIILAIGIATAGFFVGHGFKQARLNRFVSVKGLAEMPVTANHGTWEISYASSGTTFDEAIKKNKRDNTTLKEFLLTTGLKEEEMELMTPRVTQNRSTKSGVEVETFNVQHSVLIKSSNVQLVKKIASESSKILENGIVLNGWQSPSFYFTELNTIKPEMIAKATRAAREAAEKFAKDAKTPLVL